MIGSPFLWSKVSHPFLHDLNASHTTPNGRRLRIGIDSVIIGHTFYQLLGNEAFHLNALRQLDDRSNETARATEFHQIALTGVRKQLETSVVTDDLIGTVAGFLLYAASFHTKQ